MTPVRVAAVQATPVFLDREATIAKAVDLAGRAAAEGARVIVFPESFVPGYPDWVWRSTPWSHESWYARLLGNAVDVPSPATEALGAAAREHGAYLVMGVTERAGGTLYNTLLFFGPDGGLLGRHRKLMATGGERLIWGMGDGSSLRTYPTPYGRLGGLICWENYMPMARQALYAAGVDLYAAPTWDNSDVWLPTLRHIAKEGRAYVIGVTPLMRGTDIPADLPGRDEMYGGADDWLSEGNSAIVAPDGTVLTGPLTGEEGILHAEVDVDQARAARQHFDPVGHYARPDIFRLLIDTTARTPVETFTKEG